MIKTISYLGLGTMGTGMVSNLLKAGYKLTVWNRTGEKCEPFARKGPAWPILWLTPSGALTLSCIV
jgi:3-hydroxyisobutyrate dehydrogenase-like beta-hydroxyacid dehydrogenase